MATAALLKANPKPLNLKQSLPTHLRYPSKNRLSFITQTTRLNAVKLSSSSIGGVKCFSWKQPPLPPEKYHSSFKYKETPANPNPIQFVADVISKALKLSAIVAVLFGALLMYDPNSAWAASAGRMGGSSFSSYESSSGSYSSGSSSDSYFSAPYSYSSGSSIDIDSDSDSYFSAPYSHTSTEDGESGAVALRLLWLLLWLIIIVSYIWCAVKVIYILKYLFEESCKKFKEKECSVIKLQVGLLGTAQSLQKNLNEIAGRSDTSTQKGLHNVLEESVLALLRHPAYFISGYSYVKVKGGPDWTEILFNSLCNEERGKVDEETLVNVNNIRYQITKRARESGISNEYIVVSIIVAAIGVHKLPTINGSADLKEALQKLGSIPSNKTLAVEVLWTPQQENDTLSEQEVLKNYPLLRPF